MSLLTLPVPMDEDEDAAPEMAPQGTPAPVNALMALFLRQQKEQQERQRRQEEANAAIRGDVARQRGQAQALRNVSLLSSFGANPLLRGLQDEAGNQGAQLEASAARSEGRIDSPPVRTASPLELLRAVGAGARGAKPQLSSDPTSAASKAAQARVKAIIPGISDADLATVTEATEPNFLKYRSMTEGRSQRGEQFAKTLGFKWADLNQDERLSVMRLLDAQEARAAAAAARKEEGIERQTLKLSERLENMPGMANDLATLTVFAQKEDVPGVGATGLVPAPLLTKEGAEVRQTVRGVVGTLIKEQSGAAATEQEVDRKMEELGMGPKASDREFRLGLRRLLENTESVMGAKEAGVSPEAVQRFRQRGGTTAKDLPKPKEPPKRGSATQAMPTGVDGNLTLEAPKAAEEMVPMISPKGVRKMVPRSRVQDAIAAGGRLADG